MKIYCLRICQLFLVIALPALMAETLLGQNTSSVRLSDIEQIRNLTLLQQETMDKLKSYINNEFNEMFEVKDPSDKTQNLLKIAQSLSRQEEVRQMYSDSYTQAVLDAASKVQTQSMNIGDKNIYLQCVIVIAGADNKLTIPTLLELIKSDMPEVKYWAISGFGTKQISMYFNSEEGKNDFNTVVSALNEMLANEESDSIIGKIADVALLTTDEGINLLDSCVKKRAKQYQAWKNIGNEMVDYRMFMKTISVVRSGVHKDFKRRESQLMHIASEIYWLAWQRYQLGSSAQPEGSEKEISIFENSTSLNNLLTILIEGEKQLLLVAATPGEQPDYRMTSNYLMNNSWAVLNKRVDVLIGKTGMVQKMFDIYGSKTEIDLPQLNAPPAELVENAQNFSKIRKNLIQAEY